jgi:hypothetical protein
MRDQGIAMMQRETETRVVGSGFQPFSAPSADLGGFREIIRPGAFTKTLQEHRELAATVYRSPRGVRFGASPVSVQFIVIQEQWLQSRKSGELLRDLMEVRLVGIAAPQALKVSSRARAIAKGARLDFVAAQQ